MPLDKGPPLGDNASLMVVGLGIDVASVERTARALDRFGERFCRRVLTARERRELAAAGGVPAQTLAGRFAAKEALSKALGGPRDVWWHDVEVSRGERGAPVLELSERARAHAQRIGAARALVSITHDAGVAAAVVILESE